MWVGDIARSNRSISFEFDSKYDSENNYNTIYGNAVQLIRRSVVRFKLHRRLSAAHHGDQSVTARLLVLISQQGKLYTLTDFK